LDDILLGAAIARMLRKMNPDIRDEAYFEMHRVALTYIEMSKQIPDGERVFVFNSQQQEHGDGDTVA
jgi:hypothetical protein